MTSYLTCFLSIAVSIFFLAACHQKQNHVVKDTDAEEREVNVYANPNSFLGNKMKIGDNAPVIKASNWYNSPPITSFEKGKVYVIEFWASWCQPCRKSIPHLNRLSHDFRENLVVIGVAAAEEGGPENLEKFLSKMDKKLSYPIAYTDKAATFNDYMVAANNTGLPWAFIVDQQGKVAWWGQPFFSQFEPTLRSVLGGTYVREDGAVPLHANIATMKDHWNIQEAFWMAYADEKWSTADSLGTQLLKSNSEVFYYEVASLFDVKYTHLNQRKEAMALALDLSNDLVANKPEGLSLLASIILANNTADRAHVGFALDLAERSVALTHDQHAPLLFLLSKLQLKWGDKKEAQKTLRRIDRTTLIDTELIGKIDSLRMSLQ